MEGNVELVEKFGMKKLEKVGKLPDGRWVFTIQLGDPRKATSKLWARKVKNVDVQRENGYAFEGEFFKYKGKYCDCEIILKEGELVVAVIERGSWKHPGQYMGIFVALEDGIYTVSSGWETKADKIQTIHLVSEILNFLNSNK